MRWLITGFGGLLAPYVAEVAAREGEVVTSGRRTGDRPCDLTDRAAVEHLIGETAPEAVIHAAGLTDVDACERDPAAAMRANRDTVAALVVALPADVWLAYVSTDQVYPDVPGPHAEDAVGPINAYGRSKLAGEVAARAHPKAIVLRTNFFGPSRVTGRNSLSDFFTRSLSAGRPITLFDDVAFSPLHLDTLGRLIVELGERGMTGTFNAGSKRGLSKAEFALTMARHLGLSTDSATVGTSVAIAGRAARPRDLRLDVAKLETALSRAMPTLSQEIGKL